MNVVLFNKNEIGEEILFSDRRVKHILHILKLKTNEEFDAGIINDSIGKAFFTKSDNGIIVHYRPVNKVLEPLFNLNILLGIIRPVNLQRTVRDLCTLGVKTIHFVSTEKSEKSYIQSKAYNLERINQYLIEGAEQAFNPRLPQVFKYLSLKNCLENLHYKQKIAFDNYEFSARLGQTQLLDEATILAIGPERGWSNNEREILREHKFKMLSLGTRVLRTETANIAAISVFLSKLGKM